jgi:hypothetical protein
MYFLRRVIALWLIALVLIILATAYGRTRVDAHNLAAFGLDLCDGKPCFLGITPGVTRWLDVPSYLRGYPFRRSGEYNFTMRFTDYISAQIDRDLGGPAVSMISIYDSRTSKSSPPELPDVGSIVLKYGAPCWVLLESHNQGIRQLDVSRLIYPMMALRIDRDTPFTMSSYVLSTQILIDDLTDDHVDLCASYDNAFSGVSWAGFASQDFYGNKFTEKMETLLE